MKTLKLLTLIALIFLFTGQVMAFKRETTITFAFPVRENVSGSSPLFIPKLISAQSTPSATPLTWLLDFDALNSATSSSYFKSLERQNNEIGVLLEVTPLLREGLTLSSPNSSSISVYLNSYHPNERQKIIKKVLGKYYEVFGTYPKSVGATYLDSYSLEYLNHEYGVVAALFGIDSPLSPLPQSRDVFPFFSYLPSRLNSLTPASSKENRLGISITYLNPSLPALLPDLKALNSASKTTKSEGFLKIIAAFSDAKFNEFSHLTFGIDNQINTALSSPDFTPYFETTASNGYSARAVSQAEFGLMLNQRYPYASPPQTLQLKRGDGQSQFYYQNPFYQIALSQVQDTSIISHLTVFNHLLPEEFRNTPNYLSYLPLNLYQELKQEVKLPLNLSASTLSVPKLGQWTFILSSQTDSLTFRPHGLKASFPLELRESDSVKKISSTEFNFLDTAPYFISGQQRLLAALALLSIILICWMLFFKGNGPKLLKLVKTNLHFLLVIILGSAAWSVVTIRNGLYTPFGLSFYGAQSHDSFFHLALIEHFKSHPFSLNNPLLLGSTLSNYHFFFDYFTALISRFTAISSLELYFRFIPPLLALIIGLLSLKLLRIFRFSSISITVSLLCLYFTGSLGFIPTWLKTGNLFSGESVFWATQNISTLINPPFALSLIFLLLYLVLFKSQLGTKRIVLLSLLGAVLIQTKVYAFILLYLSLLTLWLISVFFQKTNQA